MDTNKTLTASDTAAVALLRMLPLKELEKAYRKAKADNSEQGQHSAWLISRELIQRRHIHIKTTS